MSFLQWIVPVLVMFARIRLNYLSRLSPNYYLAAPVRIEMLAMAAQILPDTVLSDLNHLLTPEMSKFTGKLYVRNDFVIKLVRLRLKNKIFHATICI